MTQAILTLNAGSSSIKFGLFEKLADTTIVEVPLISGQVDGIGNAENPARLSAKTRDGQHIETAFAPDTGGKTNHAQALTAALACLDTLGSTSTVVGVGHRVVHGGETFSSPVIVDSKVLHTLSALTGLAPLHQPHNLAGIAAISETLPAVPQVACFDTAFHRTQPELAQRFALPKELTTRGIRRYGFHGLSYEYIADRLPSILPKALVDGRVVVAHLGNGASMCALKARRSQATTMGFTAIDGLMMGTRTGAIDPGVILHLIETHGYDAASLTQLLYKESGLLGVSGLSADMRTLLESSEPDARLAVELFCYRAVREIGSLAAAIGGIDALVFTGGIGEHAAAIRSNICRQLAWLGIELDSLANANGQSIISTTGSNTVACVVPTNEEWMIARHTARLLT